MNVYISDSHFGHANIIAYCGRPFRDADHMDTVMMQALREADCAGHVIYHLGDFALNAERVSARFGMLDGRGRHVLIAGNHDRVKSPTRREGYLNFFGRVVGTEKTWRTNMLIVEDELAGRPVRLLLSHAPQEDLQGCDFNLYGHTHNTARRQPERFAESYPWLVRDPSRYISVSVENIDYRPRTLAELLGLCRLGD